MGDQSQRQRSERIIIDASANWNRLQIKELWGSRELLWYLAWRDIAVRYKQSILGIAWALLQPLATIVIFTAIFGQLAQVPSDGLPYAVFALAGLVPWYLFSQALQRSAVSLVANAPLLTKVYFPRLIVPLASVLPPIVDFGIALILLLLLGLWYGITPTPWIVLLPVLTLFALLAALAAGLWLSALNVAFRDISHLVPYLLQFWMFASPIIYSANLVPAGPWRIIYSLNPMVAVIVGFRWILLGSPPPDLMLVLPSVGLVLLFLVGGLFYFKKMEGLYADIV